MEATKRTQWLAGIMLILTALALVGLLGRVFWLEKHITTDERDRLARQYTAEIPIMPMRGAILDSDGTPVALSVRMYNLFADPAFIVDPEGKLNALKDEDLTKARDLLVQALSPLVNKPADQLLFDIEQNATYANGRPRRFMWLKKEVDEDFYNRFIALKKKFREESHEADRIANRSKDPQVRSEQAEKAAILYHTLDGVGFVKSMKRVYPLGQLGGNVIGFANNYEGVDGLEHQLDFLLRGIPGSMFVTKDAARHTLLIQDQRYNAPDDGRDVWLTLNTVMQGIAQDELKKAVEEKGAAGGSCVVMDPYSGRIYAIANYPFLDPSDINGSPVEARRDKAVTDPFEPGSIFKPFIMSWAIEHHVVKPTDVFSGYNGVFRDRTGRIVRDDAGYGALTVHDILVKSSNIGMTQIGWKMGPDMVYQAINTFGFGHRTGVELPGDQKGLTPTLQNLREVKQGTLTSCSFGYGVAVTPLQLVRAFATIANGGYLITPRVINAVEDSSGKTTPWTDITGAPLEHQIISPQTCETMRKIMVDVLGPEGTARGAKSKLYQMYGKTGTAHIAAGGHGGGPGRGYAANDYNSSFLLGAPVNNPRLVLVVTLHKPRHGYFGGTVSAPAAVAIMERCLMYLQVPPDAVDAPQVASTAGSAARGAHHQVQ